MGFDLNDAVCLLGRTPGVLRSMLEGLGDQWVHGRYGENTFSPFDVVGHLIHGERTDWIVRAGIILEEVQSRTFEPFDRYAMYEASRDLSIEELLATFERLRSENLVKLRSFGVSDRALRLCGMHPDFGEVTLSQLLSTWVAHDLNHIAQVAKAMANQYVGEVGPWRAYLSILKR
jgi:DinB superfamily